MKAGKIETSERRNEKRDSKWRRKYHPAVVMAKMAASAASAENALGGGINAESVRRKA
jgi:hypothetical protein